ncbi:gamma-glutamyltransferase [Chachezhania antarctica]|uniref:gamma-glutamyltransferase n=1 Tax=Chachezhania antarctica TaxID=2340860 RepID=UPI000EADF3B7|nr:gamma-glutamyltransferase [Chachezhania antarctica]
MRDLEHPGRSPVHAPQAMAATSHPLSTQAAVDVLRRGGNAMDAAVAACAVQGVVEPGSTGIGGDCFCLYAPGGSDEVVAFNGSGAAPTGATPDWYAAQGITALERQTPHSVTVPGAVDAWTQLVRDHGSWSLGDLLQPAIGYARDGFPVSPRVAFDFAGQEALLANEANSAAMFLPKGRAPKPGEVLRFPKLAATLARIAEEGREGFYSGPVAEDIVGFLQSRGGLHTMEDFANRVGDYVTPISADFRGYTVHQCPPNGQGVTALMLLNIMAGFDIDPSGPITPERMHLEIEAGRLAYRDRNLFVADPKFSDVPVEGLLSMAHADALRGAIDPARALKDLPLFTVPRHPDTVYITVVDKDRNCCSFINTIFNGFGSGQTAPESGVILQNRGMGFVLDADHPNCIAPGKRPLHTIIPGMVTRNGRAVMPYGVMGGQYQAFGHMQFLTGLLDFGLDIQEAIDRPRFFPDPYSGQVEVEGTIPQEMRDALTAMGHDLVRPGSPIGGAQAIMIDPETGMLVAGSDPRKDGCAIGF